MAAAEAGLGEVPFALIGGMAMAAHGLSRSTADADILSVDRGVFALHRWDAARLPLVPERCSEAWGTLRVRSSAGG